MNEVNERKNVSLLVRAVQMIIADRNNYRNKCIQQQAQVESLEHDVISIKEKLQLPPTTSSNQMYSALDLLLNPEVPEEQEFDITESDVQIRDCKLIIRSKDYIPNTEEKDEILESTYPSGVSTYDTVPVQKLPDSKNLNIDELESLRPSKINYLARFVLAGVFLAGISITSYQLGKNSNIETSSSTFNKSVPALTESPQTSTQLKSPETKESNSPSYDTDTKEYIMRPTILPDNTIDFTHLQKIPLGLNEKLRTGYQSEVKLPRRDLATIAIKYEKSSTCGNSIIMEGFEPPENWTLYECRKSSQDMSSGCLERSKYSSGKFAKKYNLKHGCGKKASIECCLPK